MNVRLWRLFVHIDPGSDIHPVFSRLKCCRRDDLVESPLSQRGQKAKLGEVAF